MYIIIFIRNIRVWIYYKRFFGGIRVENIKITFSYIIITQWPEHAFIRDVIVHRRSQNKGVSTFTLVTPPEVFANGVRTCTRGEYIKYAYIFIV